MLPQGLLFTSDQQVAELILALLPEFGIEVEHRPDVFSAIEKLTGRPYHVVVVDWKEQLEASFLLKTARELTVAKSTPAVAVVDQRDASSALGLGANAVLVKPFTYEQARSTFAACLSGIRAELPSPSQASARQAPLPNTLKYGISSNERHTETARPAASRPNRSAVPARIVPPPPTFAGYAQKRKSGGPKLPLKQLVVVFALAGLTVASVRYHRVADKFISAIRVSKFVVQSGRAHAQPEVATAEEKTDSTTPESEQLDWAANSGVPASSGTYQVEARAAHVSSRPAMTTAGVPSVSSEDAGSAAIEESKVHSYVPNSLMVSLQAMTSKPETKLSSQPTRWSLEPTLLPEEAARQLIVRQVPPKYPEIALATGMEGMVTLHALVGKDGGIRDLKLIRGSLLLGRSAFDAVRQWRYKPYRVNGEAVEMQTFITVSFVRSAHTAIAQKLP